MKGEKMSNIYGMKDPNSDSVEYVGRTESALKVRLAAHIAEANQGGKSKKCVWIRELVGRNQKPTIWLIEVCEKKNRVERERYWIKYYKLTSADNRNWIDSKTDSVIIDDTCSAPEFSAEKNMNYDNTESLLTIRIWGPTRRKLQLLAHLHELKQVKVIDDLVNQALEEFKTANPTFAARIDLKLSKGKVQE